MAKGRVRIETNQESPRTYDVGRGEEITVKTRHERPKVTGGGGGGSGGVNLGCGEAIVALIIAIALIIYAIRGCVYAVETYVVKGINPNYVTSFEKAKEEAEKVKKEEERKKVQKAEEDAIREANKPENINRRIREEIEKKLVLQKGYLFYAYDCYILDNYIWGCGNLVYHKGKQDEESHRAIVYSEDGGKNYKILAQFEEKISHSHSSKIIFLEEKEGFLATSWSGLLYRTKDGGKNWDIILSSRWGIYKIIAKDKQHIIVEIWNPGCSDVIESYDGGKNWLHIINGEIIAKTTDKGLNWEMNKEKE